ncbi:hypothetical protein RKD32_007368 [Streptomyces sp. SAI-195]|uniref:hypothetical protein n=1 Tax=unclassified Streptomyces TaxID=2593676 RepID=UPI003448B00C
MPLRIRWRSPGIEGLEPMVGALEGQARAVAQVIHPAPGWLGQAAVETTMAALTRFAIGIGVIDAWAQARHGR